MEAKPRDLLSDFPEAILHHIFSFLQVKDILKLRTLSRRFNKTLCSATPSFCFCDDFYSRHCSCTHVFDFMINTVLQNRPHTLGINRISFSSFCNIHEHRELHKQWIIQLFHAFRVNELSLDYNLPSIFGSLPMFQCLKVLKLNMKENVLLILPHMKLASLETLHIKHIKTFGSIDEWISQSFPSLKHLFLQQIISEKQDFKLRSSSLEDLTIDVLHSFKTMKIISESLSTLNCFFCGQTSKHWIEFLIETPNLQSLTWVGNSLCYDDETLVNLQVTTISSVLIMRESASNVLMQLFKAIRLARELHIDTQVLQYWVRILRVPMKVLEDLDGETLSSLQNIHHLELNVQCHVEGEDYITFLERLSNLETLILVNDPDYRSYFNLHLEQSARDNFERAVRDCGKVEVRRTYGLKKLNFLIGDFCYNMVVVIGWLMKSCIDLEEMNLHYPYCFHMFMMREGLQYLHSFQRASHTPSFHLFPQKLI